MKTGCCTIHVGTSCSTCSTRASKMTLLHISLLCRVVLAPNIPLRYIQSNLIWLEQIQIFSSWFWILTQTSSRKQNSRSSEEVITSTLLEQNLLIPYPLGWYDNKVFKEQLGILTFVQVWRIISLRTYEEMLEESESED